MQWYATLIDKKNHYMANYLDQFRLPATDFPGMMILITLFLFFWFLYLTSNCIDDGKYKPGIFPCLC